MPGIIQYGNLAGAKMDPTIIPVYKATQGEFAIFEDHRYSIPYISLDPDTVIEKNYYLQAYPLTQQGSGFQPALYTSLDIHKPYSYKKFPSFQEIIRSKYNFALSRWTDQDPVAGFCMYPGTDNEIVMGWCGQADSLGFALQLLNDKYLNDPSIPHKVQKLMDFLTTYPIDPDGLFRVNYNIKNKTYLAGDPVSCGSALNNFARAIRLARKNKQYKTSKWETFLTTACDNLSQNILNNTSWHPLSSREAFYISPLYYAYKLFGKDQYRDAALKIARHYAQRHLSMEEPYWGGTLDAKCEDKEGSWACFQGFLLLYENGEGDDFLTWAKHAMDVTLSYTVIWDIPLPPGRMSDHNFKTTGWSDVSPQNQHIDVYGVIYSPEIYRMGQILNDQRLMDLARVMYRSCFQLTDPFGSQGEQLQQTNFAQRGDMTNVHKLRGGYSENWTVFWITAHFLNAAAKFEALGVTP